MSNLKPYYNNDEINFTRLDSIFTNQLSKKGIKTPHYLVLLEKDIKVGGSNKAEDIELSLFSNSKSPTTSTFSSDNKMSSLLLNLMDKTQIIK